MADAKARVKITGDATGLDSTLKSAGQSLDGFKKLAIAGVGVAAAGAIAKFGGAAVDASKNYEQAMANVGAISRATDEDLARLSDTAKHMGATTGFSAKEAADGMSFLAMAGFETNEIISAMPGTLDLAASGALDLATAADISSNVLSGFGLSADQADRAANVLAATSSSANTNVLELGEAMKFAAPVASSLGVSLEDTAGALAVLADGGIKASMAGTSVRQMLLDLAGPTPEAADQIAKLGIEAFDAAGNMKSMPEIVGELDSALSHLGTQAKADVLSTLFGKRNVGAVNLLLNKGQDELAAYTDGITGTNAAAEMAAKQFDTFQGSIIMMQSAVEGFLIEVGDGLTPALRAIVDVIQSVFMAAIPFAKLFGERLSEAFRNFSSAAGTMAGPLTSAMSAIAPIAEALFVLFVNNLEPAMAGLAAIVAAVLVPALQALAPMLGGLAVAALSAAWPFLAIGAAVAAAVAHFGGIQQTVAAAVELFDRFKPVVLGVVSAFAAFKILSTVTALWSAASAALSGLSIASTVAAGAVWLFNAAMGVVATVLGSPLLLIGLLVGAVVGLAVAWRENAFGIQEHTAALVEWLAGAWDSVVAGIMGLAESARGAWDAFLGALGAVRTMVVDWAVGLWEGAVSVFQAGASMLAGAVDAVKGVIAAGFQAAVGAAVAIFEQFKPVFIALAAVALVIVGPTVLAFLGIRMAAAAAVEFFTGTIVPAFQGFADAVVNLFGGWSSDTQAAAADMSAGVSSSASSMAATTTSTFASFRDAALGIWTSFKNGVVAIWTVLKDFIVSISQAIATFLVGVWSWIRENIIARVVSLVRLVVGAFLAWFAWTVKFWTAVGKLFWTAWSTIAKTVGNWIMTVVTFVSDKFTALGNWLGGWFDILGGIVFDAWRAIFGIFQGSLKAIWDAVSSVFRGIVDSIAKAMVAAGGIVQNIFAQIQGFLAKIAGALGAIGGPLKAAADGMGALMGKVTSTIRNMASSAADGLKSAGGKVKDFFGGAVQSIRDKFGGMFEGLKLGDGMAAALEGGAPDAMAAAADVGGMAGDELGAGLDEALAGAAGGAAADDIGGADEAAGKAGSKKSAAATVANVAKKVAEAIQEGLKALEALAGAEIPARAEWEARLMALTDFVEAAVVRFQEIATGTLTKVDVVDGVEQLSTAKADAVAATLKVLDNMFATIAKAVQIAKALSSAEFPEDPESLNRLRDFLAALRDRAVEVAEGVGVEAAEALKTAGDALKTWTEVFGTAIQGAVALTAEGVDLSGLDAAAERVDVFLGRIATMAQSFVQSLQEAVPDDAERTKSLELSTTIAKTFGQWVGVVASIGKAAADLANIPKVPDIKPGLDRALSGIANAGGVFVAAIAAAYESTREAGKALALSRAVAGTFAAWFASLAGLVKIATGLRKLKTVPDDFADTLAATLTSIADGTFAAWRALTTIPLEAAVESLALSSTVASTFGAWIRTLGELVEVVSGLRDLAGANVAAAFEHVVGFLDDVVNAGLPYVQAMMARARDEALEALSLSSAVAATFGAWIDALVKLAGLVREAAITPVLEPGVLDALLSNVDTVRAAFESQAVEWADAQIDAKDTLSKVQAFTDVVKTVADVFAIGQKLSATIPTLVSDWAVALARVNVQRIVSQVQGQAERWAAAEDDMAATVAKVQAFQAVVKAAVDIFKAGQGLVLAEVTVLAADALSIVLDNAKRVRIEVQALAEGWADNVEDMEATTGILKGYQAAVGAAVDVLKTAAGIALGDVTVLSADALSMALDNAKRVLVEAEALALAWADNTDEADRLSKIMEGWSKSVAGAVAALMAGQEAGVATATSVTNETIRLALDNANRVRAMAQSLALAWAENTETAKDLGDRIAAWSKATGGAVDVLGKASDVFTKVQSSNVAGDITSQVEAIRANIVNVLQALSAAFLEAEAEAGTLKRADDLAKVVSPAVEAIGKVIGTLSLENLSKNPLFNLKAGSAWMTRTRKNRLDHMAEQIKAGIQRTVTLIVEAMSGITVPDNVESDFDRLAAAFERIADVIMRIQDEALNVDMDSLKEFMAAAMFLAEGAAKIQSALGPVAGGAPFPELPPLEEPGGPGSGGGETVGGPRVEDSGVPIGAEPIGPGQGQVPPPIDATVVNEVNVVLDTDVLATVIERTRAREAYVDTTAATE